MKYVAFMVVAVCGLSGFSFGSDCTNGFCSRPLSSVLSSSRTVVRSVVRVPRVVVSGCLNGKCSHRSRVTVR